MEIVILYSKMANNEMSCQWHVIADIKPCTLWLCTNSSQSRALDDNENCVVAYICTLHGQIHVQSSPI